ncbi:TPA: hypothetical protein ACH3X1_004435 [Trebouxia sp. C0004]
MPTRVAQTVRPDLSQQPASRAGDRTFTGNPNLRPATGMEPLTADTAQRLSTSAAFPKPLASTQPAFTIGSADASVSPSKKRMHNALKTRQGSVSASTTLLPRANPFAQYGVAGVSSSQPGRTSSRGSPVATQSGFGSPQPSPRRVLKAVWPSDGAQGMNIDLITPLEPATAEARSTTSQPAVSSAFNGSATHPVAQPESTSSLAASSFFPQKNLSAPLSTQAPFQTGIGPTSQTTSGGHSPSAHQQPAGTSPSASAAPASPPRGPGPSTSAAAATAASCFGFGSALAETASASMPSPQGPFHGFGLHADFEQAALDTPSARFPGFQPGIQNHRTPGPSAAKRGLRGKLKAGTHAHTPQGTPAGTPMSTCSQGTPLTPMDISPQQNAEGHASAPTPPPQPHFTPQAAALSNPSFQFSFGASSSPDVPKQAGAKHTPKGRKSAAKSAADLPKSRFVPGNATDTSTGFSTASGSSAPAQARSASTAGAAGFGTAFGAPAQAQQSTTSTAGAAGFGTAFGETAQAQLSTAAGAAKLGKAFGTTAQAQPRTAGTAGFAEQRPTAPNGFATKLAAPSGFSASGIGAYTSCIPFSVPGRPMDSRISDACAMGLFGINLDSTAAQSATTQAAAEPAATAGASAATAGTHSVHQQPPTAKSCATSSFFAAGIMEGGNAKRDHPSASCTAPAQQSSFDSRGFFAAAAESQPTTAGQATQPSAYPFTMGAQTTPTHHSGRPLFGGEHLATNLHDKLVLEEQLVAATEAQAAQAAASYPKHFQPSAAAPAPFSAAAVAAANGASSEAAQQQAAQQSAAGSASVASAAAPTAAVPPQFIFGSSAAPAGNYAAADAAGRAAQSQPQGFSFGTAHSFPAQQAAAQPAPSEPFVFCASAPFPAASEAAGRQARDGANFPPAEGSQAGWPQAAPFSTASPAATSEAPPHFASGPVSTNSVRPGLHSPSGVAKHISSRGSVSGAGQHGRPVPGSPHARRTRPTPRKQPHPQVPQPPRQQAQAQPGRGHMAPPAERAKVEAAAERDRQQGNMAFAKPDYLAAGKLYTQGLNTLDRAGIHDGEVFVRLLTNRAACHLSLARPLSALKDCRMAVEADPTNSRAATRAATCHIKMGQLTEATAVLEAVKATVPAGHPVPPDLASKQSDLELTKRMVTEATAALQAASNMPAVKEAQKQVESLSWEGGYCPFSQSLQALNATALLRLHRFDEAVSLARKHAAPSRECPSGLHWPWWVQAQAAFLKGDLAQMREVLQGGVQKLEQHPDHQEDVPTRPEVTELLEKAQKLLQLKEAGNRAVQAQQWQDAIKVYTLAITACADAPPVFAAVLHSNRAAAHQHLEQYTDAVADSLRAKALDPSYAKVYSRLAAVLGSLHLSSGVVAALEQLAELMKSHGARDPFKTASRLSQARGDVRRKQPVHHYRLLGLSQTCSSEEVRKAYKKCSLRFHPDKAITHCKFAFSLGLQGAALGDRLEIETRVRDEANWLFKCISEANVVLSDSQKRHILDGELEFEERRMFYRNDLSTPPGGSYSFSRPAASASNRASANPRPAANPQPSAHARAGMRHSSRDTNERAWWQNGGESDDSDDDLFGSHADSGSNFY